MKKFKLTLSNCTEFKTFIFDVFNQTGCQSSGSLFVYIMGQDNKSIVKISSTKRTFHKFKLHAEIMGLVVFCIGRPFDNLVALTVKFCNDRL